LVTTKVKSKLFDDNILREVGISVDTFGGYVTLTGAVENEKQRERATAIVESVYGVRKVNNLLMIKK
jgi:hyperosmotically inducible periplasmic protein